MTMKKWKKTAAVLCAAVLLGCGSKPQSSASAQEAVRVEMTVKDYGTIVMEMDPVNAPITVENFVKLAESGFYDGLTFHRIMDGFMIQGGASANKPATIQGEFSSNGWENKLSHVKGTVSMARANDPNSASSQFFICVADDRFLDGDYAAFGTVVEGLEIAEKIAKDAKPVDNNGTIPKDEQPIIEKMVVKRP